MLSNSAPAVCMRDRLWRLERRGTSLVLMLVGTHNMIPQALNSFLLHRFSFLIRKAKSCYAKALDQGSRPQPLKESLLYLQCEATPRLGQYISCNTLPMRVDRLWGSSSCFRTLQVVNEANENESFHTQNSWVQWLIPHGSCTVEFVCISRCLRC